MLTVNHPIAMLSVLTSVIECAIPNVEFNSCEIGNGTVSTTIISDDDSAVTAILQSLGLSIQV